MDVYTELREKFRRDLREAGFERVAQDQGGEAWTGTLEVMWDDPQDGTRRITPRQVKILLRPGFPWQRPLIVPMDDPPLRGCRHQQPGEPGELCLWPRDDGGAGWMPGTTAGELLERIREWFAHYHRNDWGPTNRPPDLHLYFNTKELQPLMLVGDDWSPPTGVKTGRFGVWQRGKLSAFAAALRAGVDEPEDRHTDRILRELGMMDRPRDHTGLWFRLREEPRPHPTLGAMLAEIDRATGENPGWTLGQLRGLLGERIEKTNDPRQVILGLGYPDVGGVERWLFLRARIGDQHRKARLVPSTLSRIGVGACETAPVGREALLRRTGHLASQLEERRIIVFGQGAIGSSLSLLIAKAGMPKLALVDSARLRPGNAVRHAAGLFYVGWLKTEATRAVILSHAPDCEVRTYGSTWDPETLEKWIREADGVVDAAANPAFSLLLNQICLRVGRPAIYVTAHRRAAIGRIRAVRPGRDACPVCYLHYQKRGAHPVIPQGSEGEFVEEGCGVPTVEGSAVDVEAVANQGARVMLWLIRNILGEENHWLIVNDGLPEGEDVLREFGVHQAHWAPAPECTACGAVASVA